MALVRVPCPTCGKETRADDAAPLPEAFPFCSVRCRLLDLGKWADEEYRIGRPLRDSEGDASEEPEAG